MSANIGTNPETETETGTGSESESASETGGVNLVHLYARRDIERGEEILENYEEDNLDIGPAWFEELMDQYDARFDTSTSKELSKKETETQKSSNSLLSKPKSKL